jgi:predicted acetyltransferase
LEFQRGFTLGNPKFIWLNPRNSHPGLQEAAGLITRSFPLPADPVSQAIAKLGESDFVLRYEDDEQQLGCLICASDELCSSRSRDPIVFLNWAALEPTIRTGAAATHFFKGIAHEATKTGAVAAFLYPVSWPLYQSLGFGLATNWKMMSVPMTTVRGGSVPDSCRYVNIGDLGKLLVEFPHSQDERRLSGKSPLLRSGLWEPFGSEPQAYVFEKNNKINGYVVLRIKNDILEILDYAFSESYVARSIVRLAATFGSICRTLSWIGDSGDIIHRATESLSVGILNQHHSLTRILNLSAALNDRPVDYHGQKMLDFAVRDNLFPENEIRVWLDIRESRCNLVKTSMDIEGAKIEIPISALSGMMYGNYTLKDSVDVTSKEELYVIADIDRCLRFGKIKLFEKSFF